MKSSNLMSSKPDALKKEAFNYKSWQVTERQICDLELLLNGAFAPLTGFMGEADYQSVLNNLRLKDGSLWPMPISLDVDEDFAKEVSSGDKITLRDHEGFALAVLTISDIFRPNFRDIVFICFCSNALGCLFDCGCTAKYLGQPTISFIQGRALASQRNLTSF